MHPHDLVWSKQRELGRAGELNRFYRTCIRSVLEGQPVADRVLTQFAHISHGCRQLVLDLEGFIASITQQLQAKSEESSSLRERLGELEKRMEEAEGEVKTARLASNFAEERLKTAEGQITATRREAEAAQEKANRRVADLERDLVGRNTLIFHLQEQHFALQKWQREIEKELQKKDELSASISDQSEHLSLVLKEKTEEVSVLKSKNKELEQVLGSKQLGASLLARSSIILSINNQQELPPALALALEREVRREVRGVERLYSFRQQRSHNFHESVDKRNNILLVCMTVREQVIGAFTTAAFTIASRSAQPVKAFLFGMVEEEISINPLKPGRESVAYDWDFLIFGNEQLCIEKGKSLLTSYFPTAVDSQLHYQRSLKEDYFLAGVGERGEVELKNYEIYAVDFEQ